MKTKYIVASLLCGSLAFTGCQDMDTLPEGGYVTDSQKEDVVSKLPQRAEAKVNAIFATLNQAFPNAGALGAERHNDIGYGTLMLALGANGEDEISADNGYNWTGFDLTLEDRFNTNLECQMVWNNLYSIVFAANKITATIDEKTEDQGEQYYLGQALGSRGFAYLIMAQLYQFNYTQAADKLCVPIITEKNTATAEVEGCEASTVAEVYEQVNCDLSKAIDLLAASKVKPADKRYISLATAYGLRARMNLAMGKKAEANADALAAIKQAEANGISLLKAENVGTPSFWSVNEPNWMWGIIIESTDDVVSTGICNFPSHMGSLSYGYANYSGGRQISKKLYAEIKEGDYRIGWWLKDAGASTGEAAKLPNGKLALTAEQTAYVNENGYAPYTQMKFGPDNDVVATSVNANDLPLMRLEEMYLIAAETGSADKFEAFVKSRATGEAVSSYKTAYNSNPVEAVYTQRRLEFWGEGIVWFDLMRLNKGIDRRGCGYGDPQVIYNINAGDDILLWRVPEAELQANKPLAAQQASGAILGSGTKPTAITE